MKNKKLVNKLKQLLPKSEIFPDPDRMIEVLHYTKTKLVDTYGEDPKIAYILELNRLIEYLEREQKTKRTYKLLSDFLEEVGVDLKEDKEGIVKAYLTTSEMNVS